MTGPKVNRNFDYFGRLKKTIQLVIRDRKITVTPSTQAYLTYARSVQVGTQSGIEECKQQFAWDKWNCPDTATQLKGLRRGRLRNYTFTEMSMQVKAYNPSTKASLIVQSTQKSIIRLDRSQFEILIIDTVELHLKYYVSLNYFVLINGRFKSISILNVIICFQPPERRLLSMPSVQQGLCTL